MCNKQAKGAGEMCHERLQVGALLLEEVSKGCCVQGQVIKEMYLNTEHVL